MADEGGLQAHGLLKAKLSAAFEVIGACDACRSEKSYLRKQALLAVLGEGEQASGCSSTSLLYQKEQLVTMASTYSGKPASIFALQGKLHRGGRQDLAKRVMAVNKGRRAVAHPDTDLVQEVAAALAALEVAGAESGDDFGNGCCGTDNAAAGPVLEAAAGCVLGTSSASGPELFDIFDDSETGAQRAASPAAQAGSALQAGDQYMICVVSMEQWLSLQCIGAVAIAQVHASQLADAWRARPPDAAAAAASKLLAGTSLRPRRADYDDDVEELPSSGMQVMQIESDAAAGPQCGGCKQVEQIVGVPVHMTQEEVVHVPTVITQQRVQQQHVEQIVEVPVPMVQGEMVHVPKIMTQHRIHQQQVEQIVEVPVHMTQEEVVHVPKTRTQQRIHQQQVEQIVEVTKVEEQLAARDKFCKGLTNEDRQFVHENWPEISKLPFGKARDLLSLISNNPPKD